MNDVKFSIVLFSFNLVLSRRMELKSNSIVACQISINISCIEFGPSSFGHQHIVFLFQNWDNNFVSESEIENHGVVTWSFDCLNINWRLFFTSARPSPILTFVDIIPVGFTTSIVEAKFFWSAYCLVWISSCFASKTVKVERWNFIIFVVTIFRFLIKVFFVVLKIMTKIFAYHRNLQRLRNLPHWNLRRLLKNLHRLHHLHRDRPYQQNLPWVGLSQILSHQCPEQRR